MMKLTREQREALKRVYDRHPVTKPFSKEVMTYREFRKTIVPELGGWGAIMVPWCGMWLGIERDGHTHS